MTNGDYWVEISQAGRHLGAGFLITRCYALTALHCLNGILPGNDDLEISFAAGETVPGRVHRRSEKADLALIDVPKSGDNSVIVPNADRASTGEAWRNPYRPSVSHAYLSGEVAAVPVNYQCERGDLIEALQLGCSQPLGDYSGYSGGPIERNSSEGVQAVLGVLIEQYPEQYLHDQEIGRASPVLFAATIAEAFRRFDCFDVMHLLNMLDVSAPRVFGGGEVDKSLGRTPPAAAIGPRIGAADSLLKALHEWQKRGLIDEIDVPALKLRLMQGLIDGPLSDDL